MYSCLKKEEQVIVKRDLSQTQPWGEMETDLDPTSALGTQPCMPAAPREKCQTDVTSVRSLLELTEIFSVCYKDC